MRDISHRKTYSYEVKLAAVQDHLEAGISASEAMRRHGIESKSAFFRWCAQYRAEGASSLVPKKRGRAPRAQA